MLIRLHSKCKVPQSNVLDHELVDVLRALSMLSYDNVIGRNWHVQDLRTYTYFDQETVFKHPELISWNIWFPKVPMHSRPIGAIVEGEHLLERSALFHQVETGLFLRIKDRDEEIKIAEDYQLSYGPPRFQASNVDLEIRCDDFSSYEIITEEDDIIACLQYHFAETELVKS